MIHYTHGMNLLWGRKGHYNARDISRADIRPC